MSLPIKRPRVETRLRDVISATPLTLVQAPLGTGKSTALALAFSDETCVAWFEVKPWYRKAFVEPAVAAVRTVRADFGRMTLAAAATGASATQVGHTFAEELAHIDAPLYLIIDNAHVLSGENSFVRFMVAALHHLPASVHVVLVGRALPDIPLGEFVARGRAAIVDGALFAFDATEIEALAAQLRPDVSVAALEEIAAATDGWATGVVLALQAGHAVVPTAEGPRSAAAAYLAEQLFPELSEQVLTFLEETSVFETLDLGVLKGDAFFDGAQALISQLQRGGALMSEVASGRFRFHPIMRELSWTRLKARGGAGRANARASISYAKAGEIGAALFHVDAAEDATESASFLRAHAESAVSTADRARVRLVASRIDPEGPDGDIRWYVDGLLAKARGSRDARARFERALQSAEISGNAKIAFAALAQVIEHDIGRLRYVDSEALDDLAERAKIFGTHAIIKASVLAGWAKAVTHNFEDAVVRVEPLLEVGDPSDRFNTGILYAYAQTALGAFDVAEEALDALVHLLESDDRVALQALTLIWFSRLAIIWGRTTVASDAAKQALRLAERLDLRSEEAALYSVLAEIAAHNGDVEAAVKHSERARGRADHAWYIADIQRVRAFAAIALARAAFLGHDNAIARELALRAANAPGVPVTQRAVALTEGAMYTLLCDPPSAAKSIALASAALREAVPIDAADAVALATADDLLAFLDAANGRHHEPPVREYKPFANLLESRRGLVTFEHAGVAVGNARRGAGSGEAFETALGLLTRDGPRFEARLMRAYASRFIKAQGRDVVAPPGIDLTGREIEILSLLVDGLTNKEIAQRLFLSPRTVETHVERVLGKLQVGSRSRAIAMALRLGIVTLPPV